MAGVASLRTRVNSNVGRRAAPTAYKTKRCDHSHAIRFTTPVPRIAALRDYAAQRAVSY